MAPGLARAGPFRERGSQERLSGACYNCRMKRVALVALALVLTPVVGAAQDAPPPGPPPADMAAMAPPNAQMESAMRATREQMRQLREQTRTQMLAGLTAPHRAQLATLIGQFAIAPNPDPRALEKQIDALLTRGEAQNIVNLASTERTSSRNLMEAARAQYEASLTPDQLAKLKEREQKMEAFRAEHEHAASAPDPGRELLHEMIAIGGEHGPPGGPHQ